MSYPLFRRCMEYASRNAYATRRQWKRDVLLVRNVLMGRAPTACLFPPYIK